MSGRHHEGRRVSDVAGGVGGAEVIAVLDAVLQPGVAKAAFEGGRQLLLDSVVGGPRADHDERYRVRRAEPAHGGGPVARARRDVVEGRRGGVVVDPERLAGRVAGAIATRSGHAHPGALGTAVGERGAAIEPGYRVGSGEPKFDGGVVPAVVIRRPALRGVQVRRRRGVVEQWDVAAGDVAGHVAAGPRNRRGGAVRSAVGDCRAALEPRRGVAAVEDWASVAAKHPLATTHANMARRSWRRRILNPAGEVSRPARQVRGGPHTPRRATARRARRAPAERAPRGLPPPWG